MMTDRVQVKAEIPRELKRRAFAALALREETFNRWLQRALAAFLQESDQPQQADREAFLHMHERGVSVLEGEGDQK